MGASIETPSRPRSSPVIGARTAVEGARRRLKRKMSCRLPIGEAADRDDYAESHAWWPSCENNTKSRMIPTVEFSCRRAGRLARTGCQLQQSGWDLGSRLQHGLTFDADDQVKTDGRLRQVEQMAALMKQQGMGESVRLRRLSLG